MLKGVSIRVTGKVQGVWFRRSTQLKARQLDLKGWVQNEPDGSVLMEAFGYAENLQKLLEWCHHGPEHAIVEEVVHRQIPFREHPGFDIIRS